MSKPSETTDARRELLVALLVETNLDLRSWRERNWIALRDAVAGIFAVAGISTFRGDATPLFLLLALGGIAVAAHVYLKKNFGRYEENVLARQRIERALGLHDKDAFLAGEPLFPEAWATSRADPRGSYTFIASIWILAALTALAVAAQWAWAAAHAGPKPG